MSSFLSSLKSLAVGAANVAKYQKENYEEENEPNANIMHLCELTAQPGESGYIQWLDAMKKCARLPGGIPAEFRKQLWLTLAERYLEQRGVDWQKAEMMCFNEKTSQDDKDLSTQIVKDLHRTGCSLFCGATGRDNQAVLRKVLLGFARWNPSVGYCQGLNVLAALILQVTDRAEGLALKIMIYLIDKVLPEGYYADNLRGLSIDMAVFCDLMRMKLPKLSHHLEALLNDNKDKTTGSNYEPPLTNVFTMQWFLTLFCHCLPQKTVFGIWDLIYLEGSDILLKTALAIWEEISDRVMTVTSADEFYSIMGVLTREMLELTDTNNLITTIVNMGPLYGITDLREKHRYNITSWARPLSDSDETDIEEDNRLEIKTPIFGISQRSTKDRILRQINPIHDKEKLALDIYTLKQQYAKLRERQRQAHIILSAAVSRPSVVATSTSQAMNHLLIGKGALVNEKSRHLGSLSSAISSKVHARNVSLNWKHQKNSKEIVNDESLTSEPTNENETSVQIESPSSKYLQTIHSKYSRNDSVDSVDSDSGSGSTELCDDPDSLSDSDDRTSMSDCYFLSNDISSLESSQTNSGKQISVDQPAVSQHLFDDNDLVSSLTKITSQIGKLSKESFDDIKIKMSSVDDKDYPNEFQSPIQTKIFKKSINQISSSFIDDSAVKKLNENNYMLKSKEKINGINKDNLKLKENDFSISKYSPSQFNTVNFTSVNNSNMDHSKSTKYDNQNTLINNSNDEKLSNNDLNSNYRQKLLIKVDLSETKKNQTPDNLLKSLEPVYEHDWRFCINKEKETVSPLMYRPRCYIPMTVNTLQTESFSSNEIDNIFHIDQSPNIAKAVSPFYSILNPSFEMMPKKINSSSPDTQLTTNSVESRFDKENDSENFSKLSTDFKLRSNLISEFIQLEDNSEIPPNSIGEIDDEKNYKLKYFMNNKSSSADKQFEKSDLSVLNVASDNFIDSFGICQNVIGPKDRDSGKCLERSWTSLDRQFDNQMFSKQLEEVTTIQKCSSDILDDWRHLEACESDGHRIRKNEHDWTDLKSLEARRKDTFSDSASGFSQLKLDHSRNDLTFELRKTYKIRPKIYIDENSDSILNNYSKSFGNMEAANNEEPKLGVWTKVQPRRQGENRKNSDRALKIIQENSVILHKILTGQARKSIPDLEDISEEITISPINEEISKIFSPLLEKMGFNEHEISKELSRIDFDNFDQMKLTAGSEFDSKINDELTKRSLINDNGIVDVVDLDNMLSDDVSAMREARIDKQINDELSKLSPNYDINTTKFNIDLLTSITSPNLNTNEFDVSDLSSISSNIFTLDTSNGFNEIVDKDYKLIQDSTILLRKYKSIHTDKQYNNVTIEEYDYPYLSAESNLDIHNELEKLSIMSSKILSSHQHSESQTSNMPHISTKIYSPQTDLELDSLMPFQCAIDSQPFIRSPTYKINGKKCEHGMNRPILSKETLEFRVRYGFEDKTSGSELGSRSNYPDGIRYDNPFSSSFKKYISDNTEIMDQKISEIETRDHQLYNSIHLDDTTSPNCKFPKHDSIDFINSSLTSASSSTSPNETDERMKVTYKNVCDQSEYSKPFEKSSTTPRKVLSDDFSNNVNCTTMDNLKNNFSPFPKRSTTRKPNKLGLKLGLYTPSSPNVNESKKA
ncbi:probable WRKY transcription factor protein 1 isoform X1 [Aphidius gifuensis]|uniref:probable WRKY transcription factor protein 1 isoform X1 n=1 Tax=Aphidius gifuensis TaxID=684658 RepID=UPI001CDBF443|nr:probable WRKY transcription factor protein 1 isoform X1 [Aphidius gifuensis]